jgi:hypothetical protein
MVKPSKQTLAAYECRVVGVIVDSGGGESIGVVIVIAIVIAIAVAFADVLRPGATRRTAIRRMMIIFCSSSITTAVFLAFLDRNSRLDSLQLDDAIHVPVAPPMVRIMLKRRWINSLLLHVCYSHDGFVGRHVATKSKYVRFTFVRETNDDDDTEPNLIYSNCCVSDINSHNAVGNSNRSFFVHLSMSFENAPTLLFFLSFMFDSYFVLTERRRFERRRERRRQRRCRQVE